MVMVVVITGVSGGLGSYLADALSEDHFVIGTYYSRNPMYMNAPMDFVQVDVCSSTSVAAFAKTIEGYNDLALINLAGVSEDAMAHKMPDGLWDSVMDVNLRGTFLMCKALLPYMRENGWGRIINVSSVVGQMGVPGTAAYSASKAGVLGLTRTLAIENATKGITVNALALGYFNAGMLRALPLEVREHIREAIPMKRFGSPLNIELAVHFLLKADYITGATININGGLL
jgi:NAD(P)-dependent dehydrogenase (short-subunit alcohol dehydrogenase family)